MSAATSSIQLLPDWTEFERDYVRSGVPHDFVVRNSPRVSVFVDQGGSRLGARFAVVGASATTASTLSEIEVATIVVAGATYIELATRARGLYANFFGLIAEVVSDVVAAEHDPREALARAITRWETLLSRKPLLSTERQAGLFGELWLLERLARTAPVEAIDAWTGPANQAHDFRRGDNELEVKTSGGAKRVHTINGVGQLEPSPRCKLFLLSLQLGDGGTGGDTLADAIGRVERLIEPFKPATAKFKLLLESLGYNGDDAGLYPKRYRVRSLAYLIPVAPGVPRITRDALQAVPAEFAPERLGRITYQIDVDGLGFADGTPQFNAVIPAASTE